MNRNKKEPKMSPSTVTQVLDSQSYTDYEESKNTKHNGHTHINCKNKTQPNIDVYAIVLKKQKEPSFMKPVREWEKEMGFVTPIKWGSSIAIISLHVIALGWYLYDASNSILPKWQTVAFSYFAGEVAGFGVTAGAHRYWCHRSYKAKWPLQIILAICYSVAGQNTIYEWVRDHRVHHKFSETTADPHNANRGFFFSHVGWLMMKKHPDVIKAGQKLDLSDITNDPLVQFHTRYFLVFKILCCWVLPILVPRYMWNELWRQSILSQTFIRYALSLNFTWSVNSFAHLWGNKPYDKNIMPSENRYVSMVAMGEGWHNYHHTFPWDYKAAELGVGTNLTTTILNYFAKIGWAYDMKQASPCLVKSVAEKKGDPRLHFH